MSNQRTTPKASDYIGTFVTASEVFPGTCSDLETLRSLLSGLSRTDTLFWCARLNLILGDVTLDHKAKQQWALNQFLTPQEIHKVNAAIGKRANPKLTMVFFRGQLLELIRWVSLWSNDLPDDGQTFEDPLVRRRFAQAALIAGEIWGDRVFKDRLVLEKDISVARRKALGAVRKGIDATATAPLLPSSLGRGWRLFHEYMPRYYASFDEEFCESTGLSVEDYYACFCWMVTNCMDPRKGTGILNLGSLGDFTHHAKEFHQYLQVVSSTPDELRSALWDDLTGDFASFKDAPPYDYRPLRDKPILQTPDSRAIILDPVFYSDSASVGPLFQATRGKPSSQAHRLFGAFGDAFEAYACDILRSMYPEPPDKLAKRLSCKSVIRASDGDGIEVDAWLNDMSEAILFEMKAVWLREGEILSDDYETFLTHLRDKYVSGESPGQGRNKGLSQLAAATSALSDDMCSQRNRHSEHIKTVYPVLLTYDPLMAAPVYGDFLASEFKAILQPDEETETGLYRKGRLKVTAPIVMDIETLENLEVSIQRIGLGDVLADYSDACPDRIVPLQSFLAFSKYGKELSVSRSAAASAQEILQKALDLTRLRDE